MMMINENNIKEKWATCGVFSSAYNRLLIIFHYAPNSAPILLQLCKNLIAGKSDLSNGFSHDFYKDLGQK
jgi:hypothetical protein